MNLNLSFFFTELLKNSESSNWKRSCLFLITIWQKSQNTSSDNIETNEFH